LPILWLLFFALSYKIFARRSARNNSQSFSETSGMMPNFAGVEKFFAHMTRPVRLAILVASNSPRAKS
jgi:hypothetical protein